MSKFKVGDKVEVLAQEDCINENTIGYVGYIEFIEESSTSECDDGKVRNFQLDNSWWYSEDELKTELTIKIKYFDPEMPELEFIQGEKSDWIDVRAAQDIEYKQFDFVKIPLGIAMELPDGYEAHLLPRGSTYKNFGIILSNSMGIVDNAYKGDNDQWFMPAIALIDGKINKYDRIAQFRIIEKMPKVNFIKVDKLENDDRGGDGSTGTK